MKTVVKRIDTYLSRKTVGDNLYFLKVILGAVVMDLVEEKMKSVLAFLYFFLATMLPVLVTVAAYAFMIVAVSVVRISNY